MDNKIIAGVGVAVVAGLGYVGFKAWRQRSLKKSASEAATAAMKNSTPEQQAQILQKVLVEPQVATAVKTMERNNQQSQPELRLVPALEEKVEELQTASVSGHVQVGNTLVRTISNIRVGSVPMFWQAGLNKIRRPDVIEISEADFFNHHDIARGFHHFKMDGLTGILHVTKNNRSAVLFDRDGTFHGISTSVTRFAGRSRVAITHDRAKAFLTGN